MSDAAAAAEEEKSVVQPVEEMAIIKWQTVDRKHKRGLSEVSV